VNNFLKKFYKILFLCTLLSCAEFNHVQAGGNYADLAPVCQKLGHALAQTRVGRLLNNLFNKNQVIIPTSLNPAGKTLTIANQNGSHVETSQELIKKSDFFKNLFEFNQLFGQTTENLTTITLHNPENFNIDIKNLKTILKIELTFLKMQHRGKSENNVIKYLAKTLYFNQKKSEELITLADYLQFRHVLKIFAKQVLYNFVNNNEATKKLNRLFEIGAFKLDIDEEYIKNIDFYNGPRLQNIIRKEFCRESIFHNPLRLNNFLTKWFLGLAIRVFFPMIIKSDNFFRILNPFSISFAVWANSLTYFNPFLTEQEKERYFTYILGIFTGLIIFAEPICFDWFIYTPINRIIRGIKNYIAYYKEHQEQ